MLSRSGGMYWSGTRRGAVLIAVGVLASAGRPLHGQTDAYPERPQLLPESEEIALAMSAAPKEVSAFQQEMMELRLRFEGNSEAEVRSAVTAAYAAGTLRRPARTAVTYMLSPSQVLVSSPLPEGRRVGAWHPHLMIAIPYATGEQLGFGKDGNGGDFALERSGEAGAQLIVPVARWADSSKAAESR